MSSTGKPARDERARPAGSFITPPSVGPATFRKPLGRLKPVKDFIPLRTDEKVMTDFEAYLGRGAVTLADCADGWNAALPPMPARPNEVSEYLPPRGDADEADPDEAAYVLARLAHKRANHAGCNEQCIRGCEHDVAWMRLWAPHIDPRFEVTAETIVPDVIPGKRKLTRKQKQALNPRDTLVTATEKQARHAEKLRARPTTIQRGQLLGAVKTRHSK